VIEHGIVSAHDPPVSSTAHSMIGRPADRCFAPVRSGHAHDMRIAILVLVLVAIVFAVVARLVAQSRSKPKRLSQPGIETHAEEFPHVGESHDPHRPDGSTVPGSEHHRNERGQA
jgi:hypothetical protein